MKVHVLGSARWKHAGTVRLVGFAAGRGLSVGDSTIRTYDLDTLGELASHPLTKTEDIRAAALSPDGRAVAAAGDGFLTVSDVATGKRRFALAGKAADATALAFAGSRHLLSGTKLGGLRLLDAATGKVVRVLDDPNPQSILPICSLAVFPAGDLALVGGSDGGLSLYRLDRKAKVATLARHQDREDEDYEHVTGIAITPDGRFAASVCWGGRIVLYDHQTPSAPRLRAVIKTGEVFQSVALSADGKVALVGANQRVTLWSLARKKPIRELPRATSGYAVALAEDGKHALTGEGRGAVRYLALARARQLNTHYGHASDVTGARALGDDGLVTAGADGKVRRWSVAARKEEWYLAAHDAPVPGLAVSANGTRMLTAGEDRVAWLWDLAAGRSLARLDLDRYFGSSCAISPDGKLGVVGSSGALTLWNLRTHRRVATLDAAHGIWACGFLPDGRVVATDDDGTLRVHDIAGRRPKQARAVELPEDAMVLAVTRDGRVLAAGQHRDIWLVDPATGRVKTLKGHRDWVCSLAVSADGAWAASVSLDETVRLWRLGRGRHPTTPFAFDRAVDRPSCVTFFPDGRLAVGTARGCVLVFTRGTAPYPA